MNVETLNEYHSTAIDRLLPVAKTDFNLLDCLLDDTLHTLLTDGLIGDKAEIFRSGWKDTVNADWS